MMRDDLGRYTTFVEAERRARALRERARAEPQSAPKPQFKVKPRIRVAPELSAGDGRIVNQLPRLLRPIAREIMLAPQLNEMWKVMEPRMGEFRSPMTAFLSSVAIHTPARARFDAFLDQAWTIGVGTTGVSEVIVGGGLHAAIYAAVRVASGFPPPLVIESQRVGGSFACSNGPSFYLNSPNRPGKLTIPGDFGGGLNVLPSAILQPSDIGGDEYQNNSDLAWVIRLTLAMNAKVMVGREVTRLVQQQSERVGVQVATPVDTFFPKRVILATGLRPRPKVVDSPRLLRFEELMKRADDHFPLRGMKRVAVLGAGDGGKTAVETLTGQGPKRQTSLAALDWVERIDWYGCAQTNRLDWERCQRSRYRGLGRFFARENGDAARIRAFPQRAVEINRGYECLYVGEVPYDYVIDCRGYDAATPLSGTSGATIPCEVDGRVVAGRGALSEVYVIGPAAQLPVTQSEIALFRTIQENSTSIFRYAGRTAALAATLP